jgi:hypothetical protein
MNGRAFNGGKAGSGVWQHLINLMPPHDLYIEPFLGAGAVMRRKRPAASSLGIERDGAAFGLWTGAEVPGLTVALDDGIKWLWQQVRNPKSEIRNFRTLIYCDPPYVLSTRSCQKPMYRHELSDRDHRRLIAALLALSTDGGPMIIISGYQSKLYRDALAEWRTSSYWTTNQRGKHVQEWVWMNFPAPAELHDYRFLGADFRERERIRRRQKRWRVKLAAMAPIERLALMAALQEI